MKLSKPPPTPPSPPPTPDINCWDVGEAGIGKNCCRGLSYNPARAGASCAYNFNCIENNPAMMLKQDKCLRHNSGMKCNADKNCIVTSNGLAGFICVDKKICNWWSRY